MNEAILILVVGFSIIYIIFTLTIAWGELRLKSNPLPPVLPFVSVIVCARNEEDDIGQCLDHLVRLDYPKEKHEIILVDDESEDRTGEIFREYAEKYPNVRAITTAGTPTDLPGKQRPLDLGIRNARGGIIMVTDADTSVRPGWIKSHMAAYKETTGITGGVTRVETRSNKFFDIFQNTDQISKHAVAMGFAGLGHPLTVMGNNISFKRDAYDAVGGFRTLRPTIVEDMAMMNAIIHKGYTLGWPSDQQSVTTTTPEPGYSAFVEQRRRWVHEVHDLSTVGKLMITMESTMAAIFSLTVIYSYWNTLPLVISSLAWIAGYTIIMTPLPAVKLRDFPTIPFTLLFQLSYAVVLGYKSLFAPKSVVWKGRVYKDGKYVKDHHAR